jgi:N-acetylmuramoyl-L-alanine amidase/putative methionine-R-sulfoxide reductase with GAF domain
MSATPNNAGARWPGANSEPEDAGREQLNDGGGRDALQALLAFASLQEQAAAKRSNQPTISRENDLALDEVLGLVAARAISISGADGVAIALADRDAIVCRASAGATAPPRGARLDPNSGFSGACLRSGESIKCDDSESDPRVNAEACRALGTRSMIAVPLSAKARVIGLIEAFSSEAYGFNDSDVKSLNLLGELILAAIRPEEENRMAQVANRIVPVENAPPETRPPQPVAAQPSTPRILVDEKFAPVPVIEIPDIPQFPEKAAPSGIAGKVEPVTLEVSERRIDEPLRTLSLGVPDPKPERSVFGIAFMAGLAVLAAALGWAVIGKIRHAEQSISASTHASTEGQTAEIPEPRQSARLPMKPGAAPQVTNIRHWSSAESSTVVLDLEDQVQYESHSLDNPARIYFDLHDTKLSAGLVNAVINVDDEFVKKVRAAETANGVARIVLETKGELDFSVRLDTNPYRLTIDVHKAANTTPAATSPIRMSKPSAAVDLQKKKIAALNWSQLKIVLDAGHGGWDLGTVGRKGLLEKDLVLDIVARLGNLVSDKLGSQVIYTRLDDSYLPLEKRAEIANLAKADLFLSVHANYSDLDTARGIETYYTNTYSSVRARTDDASATLERVDWTGVDIRAKVTDSHRLAADVQKALFGGLAARNPELRNRGVKKAEYVVLTGTQMPAVLAEVSFVSSPADEDKLKNSEYRQEIAEALFRGVAKYCEEAKHVSVAKKIN